MPYKIKFKGKTYTLTDEFSQIYDNFDGEEYFASAEDENGNGYDVYWETLRKWDKWLIQYLSGRGTPECLEALNDPHNACDWEHPVRVVPWNQSKTP